LEANVLRALDLQTFPSYSDCRGDAYEFGVANDALDPRVRVHRFLTGGRKEPILARPSGYYCFLRGLVGLSPCNHVHDEAMPPRKTPPISPLIDPILTAS